MFRKGDIILIDFIEDRGYNMHEQAGVSMDNFPVPALVTLSDAHFIKVFWAHPTNKFTLEWHFLEEHFDKMEILERV